MNDETRPQPQPNEPTFDGAASPMSQRLERTSAATQTIALAATFTVDPLRRALQFWMDALEIPAAVSIAPYAQVMQALLTPSSVLSRNARGFNLVLIRLEDWIRDRMDRTEENLQHIRAVANDFAAAIGNFRDRSSVPLLLYICPSSSSLPAAYREGLERVERVLIAQIGVLPHTECWVHADVTRLYPVPAHEDDRSDRIAHIPYTSDYFVALATFLARRIAGYSKPQCKVIAVDCDNTLWKGIVGEDGPANVEFTPSHLALQELLVRQHDAGVLLCLCSKNNPEEVEAVFRTRPEMPLREEHLVSSRVNWSSKSSNLRALAKELNLGLDSFVFIDDSAIECAEVRAHCPAVLTLQLPAEQDVKHFLDHVWAFDRLGVTEEGAKRTQQYKQNRARSKELEAATDLNDFLASLQLEVDIAPMKPEQLERVAELIQRTNQFNLTGIRRRGAELEALIASGELECLVTNVRDRFGDYGLVGAILFRTAPSALEVDSFVLSCRALGRGVEHRIVNEFGRLASDRGLGKVVLSIRHSARNEPARTFLEQAFAQFREGAADQSIGAQGRFVVPVSYAATVSPSRITEAPRETHEPTHEVVKAVPASPTWHETVLRLSRVVDIVKAIDASMPHARARNGAYLAPRTPTEMAIAGIWAEVLRCEVPGMQDDFFELGGDSLQAVQVVVRIASTLGVEPALHQFFQQPTIEHLAELIADAPRSEAEIPVANRARPIPLSWSQQRLWFIHELEAGSTAYHVPVGLELRGELHGAALQNALDTLISRHEVLRTVIDTIDGAPVQIIENHRTFSLVHVDLRRANDPRAELNRLTREELNAPFDLRSGALVRGTLLHLSHDEYVLLITMHHMICDGWSVEVFIRELGILYHAYRDGRSNPLPPLRIQYADYALWQREWLHETRLQAQLEYWKAHLGGAPQVLELPTDRARPATRSYRGAGVSVSIGADLTAELKALARHSNVTLAMLLYAAWFVLLSRLSGQQDVVIGMPVANRPRAELEGLIGFFVNTLAVRIRLADDLTVEELLQRVKRSMLGAYANQDLPLEKIVEALQVERSLARNAIFQVLFVFQNAPRAEVHFPELTMAEHNVPLETAQFDLSLSLRESAGCINGTLNFATDLFDAETILEWSRCFVSLLRNMVRQPSLAISRLPLLDEEQRVRTIEALNASEQAYPRHSLIPELFEAQTRRAPDELAIVCEGRSLTYAQLNTRANQLAHYLIEAGVGLNDLVGLSMGRSIDLFVGWLGVLKAGGAYLPLDPTYPAERLSYMVSDAQPKVVLTDDAHRQRLRGVAAKVVCLDADWKQIATGDGTHPLIDENDPLRSASLAYVIYTSGSTGRPKGTMIEHRQVLNLWHGLERLYEAAGECRRVALNASFNFDASVQQIVQLLSGRSVFVIPEETRRDPAAVVQFFERHAIDAVDCTPSQLRAWVAQGLLSPARRGLRLILVGGEPFDPELWRALASSNTYVYNVYGPTECTVDATVATLRQDSGAPHIGKPMANRRIYILDKYAQPVPIGVAGEIHIGGQGVGRGYLNRAQLTAERFVSDPFAPGTTARMYRTGDIGRLRPNSTIEYLGRNDHQVKIRGLRIELGEVEAQLLSHERVSQAVVVARRDPSGAQALVGYVVPVDHVDASVGEVLRAHLFQVLPAHMVPAALVMLRQMPLTPSGKIDRGALPEPGRDAYTIEQYEAPAGEMEQALARIWQSLLSVRAVGREDNFFQLGGSSLSAMRLQARVQSELSIEVPMRVIFEAPRLRELSIRLEELRRRRLLQRAVRNGTQAKELFQKVASMHPSEIQQLLRELTMEGRK